jgi:hypothetical protein
MPEAGRQVPPPAATPMTSRAIVTNHSPGGYGKDGLSGICAWPAEGRSWKWRSVRPTLFAGLDPDRLVEVRAAQLAALRSDEHEPALPRLSEPLEVRSLADLHLCEFAGRCRACLPFLSVLVQGQGALPDVGEFPASGKPQGQPHGAADVDAARPARFDRACGAGVVLEPQPRPGSGMLFLGSG